MRRALLLLLVFAAPTLANEPAIFLKTRAVPNEIHVGDRVKMDITVTFSGVEPAPNNFGQAAGEFEILSANAGKIQPDRDGRRAFTIRLELTTFSTGTVNIPPLPLHFQKVDGTFLEARTDELPINVKSTLEELGDQGGLRPLKGLYNVRSWWWLWALLAAAAAGFAWWLWTQRVRPGGAADVRREPLLSPEDEAGKALAELELTPISEETTREYYTGLSAILRRYVERRYDIAAPEMTTSELNAAFRKLDIPVSATLICREFLDNADLVKFAKLLLPPEEVTADVGRVKAYIELTTPRPVPDEIKGPPEEAPL